MTVTGGGSNVTAEFIRVGRDVGSNGTLNVEDGATVTAATGAARGIIAENGGTGTLNVNTGATFEATTISTGSGTATINVDGASTNFKATGVNAVTAGNPVPDAAAISIGRLAGSNGTMNVTGGATVTVDAQAVVGTSGGISIGGTGGTGLGVGGVGVINVSNLGTTVNVNTGGTTVGSETTGTLNVFDQATYNTAGDMLLGRSVTSNGTATISGVGTTVNVEDRVRAGVSGRGTLNVNSGAELNASSLQAGFGATSLGNININGAATSVNVTGLYDILSDGVLDGATLNVGLNGVGFANVTDRASVLIDSLGPPDPGGRRGGITVGGTVTDTGTGVGTLNVNSGANVTANTGFAQIGRDGTGFLNVTDGGTVTLANAANDQFSVVGRKAGSFGRAVVDGTGSVWNAGENLYIGTDVDFTVVGGAAIGNGGTGLVTVSDGGVINVANNVVVDAGGILNGNGTINGNVVAQNGGIVAPGLSPGQLIINGNLIVDTGVLQLEEEGGVIDEIIVSGQVIFSPTGMVELLFETVPAIIDLADFFTVGDPTTDLVFDPSFTADDIMVFSSTVAGVGEMVQVTFGGTTETFAAVAAPNAIPEPGTLVLFGLGIAGLGFVRRRKQAA